MDKHSGSLAGRATDLVDRLGRVLHELQFVDGLNPAQWEALRFLARANQYSRSPGALADFLGTTRGTVSQTLIALEKKGYVQRARSAVDRRAVRLELTPAGVAALGRDPLDAIEQAVSALDDEVGTALVRGLSRLLHDVQQKYAIKPFGVCQDCSLLCVGAAARPTAARPTTARPAVAAKTCGFTGEALRESDTDLLCVNYRPESALAALVKMATTED